MPTMYVVFRFSFYMHGINQRDGQINSDSHGLAWIARAIVRSVFQSVDLIKEKIKLPEELGMKLGDCVYEYVPKYNRTGNDSLLSMGMALDKEVPDKVVFCTAPEFTQWGHEQKDQFKIVEALFKYVKERFPFSSHWWQDCTLRNIQEITQSVVETTRSITQQVTQVTTPTAKFFTEFTNRTIANNISTVVDTSKNFISTTLPSVVSDISSTVYSNASDFANIANNNTLHNVLNFTKAELVTLRDNITETTTNKATDNDAQDFSWLLVGIVAVGAAALLGCLAAGLYFCRKYQYNHLARREEHERLNNKYENIPIDSVEMKTPLLEETVLNEVIVSNAPTDLRLTVMNNQIDKLNKESDYQRKNLERTNKAVFLIYQELIALKKNPTIVNITKHRRTTVIFKKNIEEDKNNLKKDKHSSLDYGFYGSSSFKLQDNHSKSLDVMPTVTVSCQN